MKKQKTKYFFKIIISLIIIIGVVIKIINAHVVDCKDSDKDGIPDVIEIYLGTNPNVPDVLPPEYAKLTIEYYWNNKQNPPANIAENLVKSIAKSKEYFKNQFGNNDGNVANALGKTESGNKMFDENGKPIRNKSGDNGWMQINDWWNGKPFPNPDPNSNEKTIIIDIDKAKNDPVYNIEKGLEIYSYNNKALNTGNEGYGVFKGKTGNMTDEIKLYFTYVGYNSGANGASDYYKYKIEGQQIPNDVKTDFNQLDQNATNFIHNLK